MKAKNTMPTPSADLDAILLREVAAHRSPSGSVLDQAADAVAASPSLPALTKDPTSAATGYEDLFLRSCVVRERSALYVSAATKARLTDVVRRLGWSSLSLTSYVENILAHHLSLFREEINRLYREKNNRDIL